jgi:UDP-glucose 4-epimerase
MAESRRIVDINVMGTANMLELARELSVERFVYVSSGGVYEGLDSSAAAIREDTPVHPTQLYNVTKLTSELITLRYGELHGFETAAVRLGGPYGPMERVTGHRAVMSLLHLWTGKAVRGEAIDAMAEGRWDFTYVSDIAAGIQTVLDAPALPHQVYNLSRGVPVSAPELIAAFREAEPSVIFAGPESDGSQVPSTASRMRVQDSSLIKEDLGFETRYDLLAGLKDYIGWRRRSGYLD